MLEAQQVKENGIILAVVAIFTSPGMGLPMTEHESIAAIAGVGLEGDRYSMTICDGAFSEKRIKRPRIVDDLRQVSLIALRGIDDANAELAQLGIAPFAPVDIRRNLLVDTDADVLNDLLGKAFWVGGVQMEGVDLCIPCVRPSILLGRKESNKFEAAFAKRGGLRARILNNGTIYRSQNRY